MTDPEALDGLSPEEAARPARLTFGGRARTRAPRARRARRWKGWATHRRFSPRGLETAALYTLPFEEVRVVMVGIDPYPNSKHATGLSSPSRATPLLPPGGSQPP
jgi:hypothetical protein